MPPFEMPLVRVHPVTGRKWIAVNESYAGYIKGVSRVMSQNILGILFNMIKWPRPRPDTHGTAGRSQSGTIASFNTKASRITALVAAFCTRHDYVRARRW